MKTSNITASGEQEIQLDEDTYTVEYTATADMYYERAYISGPPEDCSPEEGECDITSVQIDLICDQDGEEYKLDSVAKACKAALNMKQVEEELWDAYHE